MTYDNQAKRARDWRSIVRDPCTMPAPGWGSAPVRA